MIHIKIAPRRRANNADSTAALPPRPTVKENPVESIGVWCGDHMRFSRLLAVIDREMVAPRAGNDPNYESVRDVVHYLHFYADRVHHPREDVAFARLVDRDPTYRSAVDRLLQEHRVIAVAGVMLLELLEDVLRGASLQRARAESVAALYAAYFRIHVATEEHDILPRAAAILTFEDWNTVEAAETSFPDPLFGDDVAAEYRALRGWVSQEG